MRTAPRARHGRKERAAAAAGEEAGVATTRVTFTTRERVLGLGSIDIIPIDPDCGIAQWQTIAKPRQVNEQIIAAIQRSKQGGAAMTAA